VVGLCFTEFRLCVEGHMGGTTKIVEPICGASKGVFKGVARIEESPNKGKLLNLIDISENFIEFNCWKNKSLNLTSLNMIIFLVC
jgi:hypothetical protein